MTISTVGVPNTIKKLASHKLQSTLALRYIVVIDDLTYSLVVIIDYHLDEAYIHIKFWWNRCFVFLFNLVPHSWYTVKNCTCLMKNSEWNIWQKMEMEYVNACDVLSFLITSSSAPYYRAFCLNSPKSKSDALGVIHKI